ncbi:MAG: hypothetical protein AB8B91_16265 [Rubripirellula sp.]
MRRSYLVELGVVHSKGTGVTGGSIKTIVCGWCLCALVFAFCPVPAFSAERGGGLFFKKKDGGTSSYAQREQVIAGLPIQRLTRDAQRRILSIAKSPTLYRRLPTQAIHCDRDMFLFLTRHPEVMVGMWDLMGITKVQTRRTGPYQMAAEDGSGTICNVDLVYGDPSMHIFIAEGSYDGKMVAKPIRGKGVIVLRSSYSVAADGSSTVTGTIDFFMQIESLGADLIARTLSGLIGRSADNNFMETARFIAQVSQASARNPAAMIDIAQRMPQVGEPTKRKFVDVITTVSRRAEEKNRIAKRPRPANWAR